MLYVRYVDTGRRQNCKLLVRSVITEEPTPSPQFTTCDNRVSDVIELYETPINILGER